MKESQIRNLKSRLNSGETTTQEIYNRMVSHGVRTFNITDMDFWDPFVYSFPSRLAVSLDRERMSLYGAEELLLGLQNPVEEFIGIDHLHSTTLLRIVYLRSNEITGEIDYAKSEAYILKKSQAQELVTSILKAKKQV